MEAANRKNVLNKKEKMKKLREYGWTYQEIADFVGVSKQYVWEEIGKRRAKESYYDNIPYKGLYKLFQEDKSLTIPKFCATVFNNRTHTFVTKMTRFISGADSHLSASQIKRILEYCGGTFEDVFDVLD